MELEPYSIEESERAAGFGSWKPATKRKIETQKSLASEEDTSTSCKKMKVDDSQ